MADLDHEDDGPSLELPSFGFGRKRRKEPRASSTPEVPATPDPGPEVPSAPGPEVPASPDPGPEVTPGTEPDVPAPRPGPGPDGEPGPGPEIEPGRPERPSTPPQEPEIDPLLPGGPPPPTPGPEIDPLIPSRPETEPGTRPEPHTPGTDPEPDPTPEPEPEPDVPEPEPETRPDPFDPDPVAPPPDGGSDPTHGTSSQRGAATATLPTTRPALPGIGQPSRLGSAQHAEADAPRAPRELRFPELPPLPAVLLVGLVVGLAAVLLTYGSLRLCDAATGTASCGGGPGLLMLLAIVITLTYLGGWLLRGFGIDDAGSTSFLAVGLVTLVAMLFLVDSLDERSGAVAVPVVTVLAYALSWRVTAALVDANADQG